MTALPPDPVNLAVLITSAGREIGRAAGWLAGPTPGWLSLLLVVVLAAVLWKQRAIMRRLDNHATSIAHMDDWADMVDRNISLIQNRANGNVPSLPAPWRPSVVLKRIQKR